ncbi:MAG: CoA ester lyase [Nitratireductor sp.]
MPSNHTNLSPISFKRSVLFMPATNERALEKSKTLNADCLIFDLEDSILEASRDSAHKNLKHLFKEHRFENAQTIIRTSALNSAGFEADLELANECSPNAILPPKVSTPQDISLVANQTKLKIWAMIETPLAIMNLKEICQATNTLECLVVGPNDLAKETKSLNTRSIQYPWMMSIIAAARAYNLSVLDGVFNNFKDQEAFATDCQQAKEMGFDGKTLIHPNQIDLANQHFGPSEQEVEKAKLIISTFAKEENQNKGAIQIEGEMIERLHLEEAELLISISHKLEQK